MDKKMRVAVLFGGRSGEHEVSLVSGTAIAKNLDRNKYDVSLIGIDKDGRWLLPDESVLLAQSSNPRLIALNQMAQTLSLLPYVHERQWMTVGNSQEIAKFDLVFPVLHGTYGEDGTIQGLLELAGVPYVGSGVLGSAVGMDKDVARRLLKGAGVPVVKTWALKRSLYLKNKENLLKRIAEEFGFPHFVKPANAGSSVGVHKVKTPEDVFGFYEDSFLYDSKILVEEYIPARELEVSVLGNDDPQASVVGEIIPHHEFYSYEAKYVDEAGATLKIPAEGLSSEQILKIQNLAKEAFRILECQDLARVDFFMDKITGKIYLNEVNTMPGFTQISMYPKLWEASGLSFSKLLDRLVELAQQRFQEKSKIKTSYEGPKDRP